MERASRRFHGKDPARLEFAIAEINSANWNKDEDGNVDKDCTSHWAHFEKP
jgi:hypothetical protein